MLLRTRLDAEDQTLHTHRGPLGSKCRDHVLQPAEYLLYRCDRERGDGCDGAILARALVSSTLFLFIYQPSKTPAQSDLG